MPLEPGRQLGLSHIEAPLGDRVLGTIRQESLVPEGGRVVIALSGGADSVALTLLLSELAETGTFDLVGVAHLNHQLRDAAAGDERFCRALAGRLSLPCVVGRADVRGQANRERISVEEAGHRERHALFRQAAATLNADRIATAHTRDDQAETYLMRLLRGAGPVGLSGIHPRSNDVVRPLLDVSKSELRAYLEAKGQDFREDETNHDLAVTRNRIRHVLIPFLERQFSPSVLDTLVRESKIARHDAEWLDDQANAAASGIVSYRDRVAVLDREGLSRQPVALAGRIAKRALEQVADRCMGFEHVQRFLTMATGNAESGAALDFPGCRVTVGPERVVIGPPHTRRTNSTPSTRFAYQLRIPGEVEIPEAKIAVSVECVTGSQAAGMSARGASVYVAGDHVTDPLIVRSWVPGDVFRPLGLGGHKKIQDLFVDRKIDRLARQKVPIVADKKRGIVWVVGHSVSDDFRVTPDTEGMLLLRERKLYSN